MQKVSVAKVDLALFNFINGFAKKSRALDFLGVFCATYLPFVVLALLAFISLAADNWQVFVLPAGAGAVSLALNEFLYLFYQRQRPMEVTADRMLIGEPFSPAFPSSHTSFFFALSFTLFLFNTPLAILFLTLSFCVSLARIFCGVHWPSDIIGGICSAAVAFGITGAVLTFIK